MEEEVEAPPENITKLVINNQMKTELHKSSPIKTYSKKSPESGGTACDTKSRYGRERKHNTSSDFLSTDHRLGQYLKQETVKEAFFKKTTTPKKMMVLKTVSSKAKRKRGRPRKSLPNLTEFNSKDECDKEFLNKSLPDAIDLIPDYQAPVPTSTETLPVPTELKGVKPESDVEEEVEDADWNCGDLAWAAVPSFPYWPCAITRDPIIKGFIKQSVIGRSTKPQVLLHVRFFGDNGRRSWVKATNLMSFTGLDDYQTMVEETCTPELKRTDPKMFKMFTVAPGQRKTWQAAVSEAESLLASPRSERILYFETLYPVDCLQDEFDGESTTKTAQTESKKRKMVEESSVIIQPFSEKKIKLDYNRYSIDLETLALQAAPITPRAIFVKKPVALTNNVKSQHKRQYIKKSEKWLLCKNKTMTGIIANRQMSGESGNGVHDDVMKDSEDDFAVPPAADLPLTPSVVVNSLSNPVKETNEDVTSIELETSKVQETDSEQLDSVMTDVSVTEMSPVESTTPTISKKLDEGLSELTPRLRSNRTPKPAQTKLSSSIDSTPDLTTPEGTPVPRKRGRPRKTPCDPDSPNVPKPVEKLPATPKQKTESETVEVRNSLRPRSKKLLSTPEPIETKPERARVKQPTPKSQIKKVKKSPKSQDNSLEIRKFGYKGSKVFKKFLELNFDKIVDERPDLSSKDVEKYIEDLWLRKTDLARQKFKSRLEAEASEEFVVDKCLSDKPDNPLALPTSKGVVIQSKKVPSLFCGIRLDRVCQICLKGDNLIRCKGPCVGYYHKECGDTRKLQGGQCKNYFLETNSRKRGRKKKSMLDDDKSSDDSSLLDDKIKSDIRVKSEPESSSDSTKDSMKTISENSSNLDINQIKEEDKDEKAIVAENKSVANPETDDSANSQDTSNSKPEDKQAGIKGETKADTDSQNDNENNKNTDSGAKTSTDSDSQSDESNDGNKTDGCKGGINRQALDEFICEKENVLPSDSGDIIKKNMVDNGSSKVACDSIKIRSLECEGVDKLKSPAQISKSESVSSEGSVKSEDSKSESDKSEGQEEAAFKKKSNNVIKKKGKTKKAMDSELENGKGKNGSTWKCLMCRESIEDSCFICRKETSEEKYRCCISSCGSVYHLSCVEVWPQSNTIVGMKRRTVLTCPQHSCHTCISDNPKANMPKYGMDKLVKCLYCPTSYHHSNFCIPAGCEILSNSQIICSRHYDGASKLHHVNAAWCFICSVGGSLICCDLCPNSFHVECLNIPSPEGAFICEDCETGRYPLYGEIIWVKLGAYRWWPARIMFPSEIPDNIKQLPHRRGEFAIRFFGSHDHYWVNRGRVFLYHEGDGAVVATKSRVDRIFNQAMIEAQEAFNAFTALRDEREAVSKSVLKPPKYFKINKNVCQDSRLSSLLKPVEGYVANLTPCDCKLEQDNPCGPNSDCINRLLMIECNPQVCPAKDKCCNQNFEKRLYPSLTPFMTDNRGWGLKTNEPIKKGDFIIEYVGEVIGEVEYQNRLIEMEKKKNENYYFLTIDKDTMIDAGPKGNVARFMNHSCDPNCETQKWTVNGVTRVGLFALFDIAKDTELVFNYQLETIGNSKVSCKCGSKSCSGFIGGAKSINKAQNADNSKKLDSEKKKPKEKKSVKRVRHAVKTMLDVCFTCDQGGELLLCDAPNCPNSYHLSCLGLTKEPSGEWTCPVHQCSVCNNPKVKRCALCINSYCNKHAQGNIHKHKIHGMVCSNHALSEESSEMDVETKSTSSSTTAADIQTSKVKTQKMEDITPTCPIPEMASSEDTDITSAPSNNNQLVNGHSPT